MQVKYVNFKKSQFYKVSFVQYKLVIPLPSPTPVLPIPKRLLASYCFANSDFARLSEGATWQEPSVSITPTAICPPYPELGFCPKD